MTRQVSPPDPNGPIRGYHFGSSPLDPDFVILHMSRPVAHGFVLDDCHAARDGFDDVEQLLPYSRLILSGNRGAVNLIDESTHSIRNHNHPTWMRIAFDRFVLEINPVRSEENKEQNQRHHYVVLNGAALV